MFLFLPLLLLPLHPDRLRLILLSLILFIGLNLNGGFNAEKGWWFNLELNRQNDQNQADGFHKLMFKTIFDLNRDTADKIARKKEQMVKDQEEHEASKQLVDLLNNWDDDQKEQEMKDQKGMNDQSVQTQTGLGSITIASVGRQNG